MALKRLDEEFELKPGTQLLPYMKRLLPSLEGRFQDLEATQELLAGLNEEIRAAALLRMNEILIPATKDILEVTQLGFLLAPIDGSYELVLGNMTFPIEEGVQRDTFTPSPYLIIEHTPDDYAIARTESYDQALGILHVVVTALHGDPGPFDDWVVSSTPGMADSTKLYHDAIAPMHAEILVDYQDILIKHAEIVQAANDLVAAGLDLYAYVRRDGTSPFDAVQRGVAPVVGSNDTAIPTTSWVRARMNEYLRDSMSATGAAMTGPLYLFGPPSAPLMASTKAYVDATVSSMGAARLSVTGGQNISGGGFTFSVQVNSAGNLALNALLGNYQSIGNNGAFTITAPTVDSAIDLMVVNAAAAGAITFTGFTVGNNTGDLLTTTNGHIFIISFRRIAGISTYVIKALQ
jgi:hypothetical protein